MLEGRCHCGRVRWRYEGAPATATLCNCTVCRRYGTLWAYGDEGAGVHLSGPTSTYVWGDRTLAFHFCPDCACVAYWRSLAPRANGRHRVGVNVRLAEPDAVAAIPLRFFDGLDSATDQPGDGRCVADVSY